MTDTAGDTAEGLRVAFYGRVSTEDNQVPEQARNWQRAEAERLLRATAPDATIVAEYFDAGQSRALLWTGRTEGHRLLTALQDPNRGWDAIVVGEGKRCWDGSQFTAVSNAVIEHDVALFVPELSGRYDPTTRPTWQ